MNYRMNIKPGLNTLIVTDLDLTTETVGVRSSIIYDLDGTAITLAQTDPPVHKSLLHKEIIVTYLVHEKDGAVRHGFPAKVTGFVDHYKLNSTQEVRALAVSQGAEPTPYSVRMFFRVKPSGKSSLRMEALGKGVNILDISLGGARFSYERTSSMKTGDTLTLDIMIDGIPYELEGRVLRTWEGENERQRRDVRFASVGFSKMGKPCEAALSRKIRDIERRIRFAARFP